MPSNAAGVATTGLAIAIASSSLFCTPRAIASGATTTSAAASQPRTSGTAPVTITRSDARLATPRAGFRPTIANRASGSLGSTSRANQRTAWTLGG